MPYNNYILYNVKTQAMLTKTDMLSLHLMSV